MPTLLRRNAGAGPWLLGALLALLLACTAPALQAQEVLAVPALSARVIDQTGTLDAAALGALEAKLSAFEAQAGPQIVVLLVPRPRPRTSQVMCSGWATPGKSAAARSATAC